MRFPLRLGLDQDPHDLVRSEVLGRGIRDPAAGPYDPSHPYHQRAVEHLPNENPGNSTILKEEDIIWLG
jgi:hypothetical protein